MNHALETHLQPARGRWEGVVTYSLYSHLALVVGYPISDFLKKDERKTSVPALASMRSLWTHACITQVFSLDELATCKCFARAPRIMTLPSQIPKCYIQTSKAHAQTHSGSISRLWADVADPSGTSLSFPRFFVHHYMFVWVPGMQGFLFQFSEFEKFSPKGKFIRN